MFFKSIKYFLVADIGGTKSTLAVIDSNFGVVYKKIYPSDEIRSFTDTVNHFLQINECKRYKIRNACIAVAGPLNNERNFVRPTNLEWNVDVHSLLVHTPLHNVVLINDFEAIGLSVDILKSEQYIELTNIGVNTSGTVAIIGAGTGLGVGILSSTDGKHIPLPSEGGHVNLPIFSNDPIDIRLQSFLIHKKLYKDAEDVVSGRGITNIYKFLLTQKVGHNKKIRLTLSKLSDEDKTAFISKYALEDKDALCLRTLELFIKYYARIARNLALTTLCSELVIAGGIAPKILSALQDVFVEEFIQHDRENMRKLLERMPVIVITDPDIALYGALNALKI